MFYFRFAIKILCCILEGGIVQAPRINVYHVQLQDLSFIGALLFTLELTDKRYTHYIFLRQTLQTVWPLWAVSVLPQWIYSIASIGGPSSLWPTGPIRYFTYHECLLSISSLKDQQFGYFISWLIWNFKSLMPTGLSVSMVKVIYQFFQKWLTVISFNWWIYKPQCNTRGSVEMNGQEIR